MKKGFTLIELIAVVAILGLIALVVYPAIGSVLRNARQSSYEDQVKIIENGAKEWAMDNTNLLPEMKENTTPYEVEAKTLVDEGYIDEEIKDPRDSSKTLDGCVRISYDDSHKQYLYEYQDECA